MRFSRLVISLFMPLVSFAGVLSAQGSFVNYEDPQVKPVTIATIESGERRLRVALICNTPDNSVEIYSAVSPFQFLARVGVGQSPVTVRWNELNGRFYTANYLGDSVTAVRLELGATPGTVRPIIERTTFVGDQPTDIVFVQNNTQAIVGLDGRSGVAVLNLADLSTISPLTLLEVVDAAGTGINLLAKMPRTLAALSDDRFYALNHLGGDIDSPPVFDMGMYVFDPNNPPPGTSGNFYAVGDIGSINFNFAINGRGTRMFVASQIARNEAVGVDAVAAQQTGFVQTWLKVIDLVPGASGGPPSVVAEQIAGPGLKPLWQSINLNRDYTQATLTELTDDPVAQVTDVALVENDAGVQLVVLAAMGSDKLVILRPDATQPSGYSARHVPLPIVNPAGNYGAVGPRGLTVDPAGVDPATSLRPGLVWVVNRLDNSFAIVNPWNGAIVAQNSLQNDPTPDEIRIGRPFLYSAFLTSGSGMVSCSSCHADARTDALVWNLGNQDPPGPPILAHFHDGNGETLATMPDFPNEKGLMVTQTLQGLLNHHIEPYSARLMATNAPYHWRGDKFDFPDFNEAFVRLQGMPDEPTIPGLSGLDAAEMESYHRFINTIHHPPNPEQLKNRTLTGDLGDPDDPDDGSGGMLGMKLFSIIPTVGPRSCNNCHMPGEGSSNTATLTEFINGGFGSPTQVHPIETAATRNLFSREMFLPNGFDVTDVSDPTVTPWQANGPYGLLHAGIFTFGVNISLTINDFIHRAFNFSPSSTTDKARKLAVTEFVRHYDTGTAPMIGVAWTVDPAQPGANASLFNLLEAEAGEANAGIAVYTRNGGVERGYWFDPRDSRYYEEGGTTSLDRAGLLALANPVGSGNVVIAQATPTGSERRVASLSGTAAVLTGAAPAADSIQLRPMVPNTFFNGLASLSGNWDPSHPTLPFTWNPAIGPEPVSMRSIRELQTSLTGLFGMPASPLRHEPPRRLRVIGENIRPGARLGIGMALQTAGSFPIQQVWFDLAPTSYTVGDMAVWETAEELEPIHTMAWLHGGYWSPGVAQVMLADYTGVPLLTPGTWNQYLVAIENEDSTLGIATNWQPMTLQDNR